MSIWSRIEQLLWTGRIVKDYGPVSQSGSSIVKNTVSALVANRGGRDRFIIKTSFVAWLSFSVQYLDLDRESALKLKVALDDAITRMH